MVDAPLGLSAYQANVQAQSEEAARKTAELQQLATKAPTVTSNDRASLERLKSFLTHFNFMFHSNTTSGESIWSIYNNSKNQLCKTNDALSKLQNGENTTSSPTGKIDTGLRFGQITNPDNYKIT